MYLKNTLIETPLGSMVAISDEDAICFLQFADGKGLYHEIEDLKSKTKADIIPGSSSPLQQIESELHEYFNGSLKGFKTPCRFFGSPFQKLVWEELMRTPYGQTRSYLTQARAIGNSRAYRAVAGANGANKLVIVVPCHRIINNNGKLGGYGGGINRKKWLIDFEKRVLMA
jgi:O-6-methylguanine DNA methyltransferase